MRVLIGCEFSGTVRRAFRARGHEAWSCDLLPAADGSMLYEFNGIPKRAIENPIMHRHAREAIDLLAPSQILQPWQYGHQPADPIARRTWARVHRASPGPDRWKVRSLTYQGIADAMAAQWGRE